MYSYCSYYCSSLNSKINTFYCVENYAKLRKCVSYFRIHMYVYYIDLIFFILTPSSNFDNLKIVFYLRLSHFAQVREYLRQFC